MILIMADDLQENYRLLLRKTAIPFDSVTEIEDWHLRIFYLPSFLPETVFDVDHRKGRTIFYRSRFLSSAWSSLMQAHQAKGQIQPFSTERASAELPATHPMVSLVTDEHIFRMGDTELNGLDGDSYVVELTHATGVVEFEAWASSLTPPWHRLLDALQSAVPLLPKSK